MKTSTINYEAACLNYKRVLQNAFSKRLLEDCELAFLADLEMDMNYKDLYYTYICEL